MGNTSTLLAKKKNAIRKGGELEPVLGPVQNVRSQVSVVEGSRADFVLEHGDGSVPTVLEVKMVLDTDHDRACDARRDPLRSSKVRFYSELQPYQRAAIFPWGNAAQKGPDGEQVVSARAIKHVDELAGLARGALASGMGANGAAGPMRAAILFVVVREDAALFRPNHEACPSFAKHLREARDAGVLVLAQRVRFGNDGRAESLGPLPICWETAAAAAVTTTAAAAAVAAAKAVKTAGAAAAAEVKAAGSKAAVTAAAAAEKAAVTAVAAAAAAAAAVATKSVSR